MRIHSLVCSLIGFIIFSCQLSTEKLFSEDELIYQQVDSLLSFMTIEEKLGQLNQQYAGKANNHLVELIREGKVGSVLNGRTSFFSLEDRNEMQRIALEESRLSIPLIFAHDVIHGYHTTFPINLGQSCSWDIDLVRQAAEIAAKEASSAGVDWAFAPMVDISRDPRWGRISECYGEDTYLNSIFGRAVVQGFQGNDPSEEGRVLACLKHYVGYGAAEGGRDYQHTELSERTLRECYLPPFKSGIEGGALSVMSAFNDISGIPATANKNTLKRILRQEWRFPGVVVSDWDAVIQLIDHGVAKDSLSAAMLALTAGVDMEMKSASYQLLIDQFENNTFYEKSLNEAVRRVLFMKFKAGLFQNPYTDNKSYVDFSHREIARKLASESMVLVKNEELLPIDNRKSIELAVVGDFANEHQLMGWWSSVGKSESVISPLQGLRANAKNVLITERVTKSTDVILACIGEPFDSFGENNSVSDVRLDESHRRLLKGLQGYNLPIVTAVFNGRPLNLSEEIAYSDAMIIAWHPGIEAGNALADIVFGIKNPSGKLTTTFPAATGQIPIFYNAKNSGRPQSDNYKGNLSDPLFSFGYGLTYTTFKYGKVLTDKRVYARNDTIRISITLSNTGALVGKETVQLYFNDPRASVTRPVLELLNFSKVKLNPGQSHEVVFKVTSEQLEFWNQEIKHVFEPGQFIFYIGPNSTDLQAISVNMD